MEAFRKVLKSKTLKEMFENIPYGFIDTVVIVILSLFILYPFTNFLYLQNIVFMPFISQHKVIIFSTPIAIFLIATYLYKKKLDGVNFDIKGFFMNIDKNLLWKKLEKFIDTNYKTDSADFEKYFCKLFFIRI